MRKWFVGTIALFLMILYIPAQSIAASPKTYPTPIKVKLGITSNFTVTVNGNYQLINLDNNQPLPISGPIHMFYVKSPDGKYHINVLGTDYGAANGWTFQELDGTNNYLSLDLDTSTKVLEYRGSFSVLSNGIYNTLDIEDYLRGVVPREMPASWNSEALKAQAVVARNYAYTQTKASGFVYDDTRSQVYGGKGGEDSRSNSAIDATKGLVMYYGTTPITAFFASSNGGHTALGNEVWSSNPGYLKSVADPYDSYNNPYSSWSTQIANDTISAKLGITGYSKIVSLKVTDKTAYGRAQQVTAIALDPTTGNQKTYTLPSGSPDSLRSAFGATLRSTMFTITPQASSAQVMMADGTVKTVDYLYGSSIKTATDSTVNLLDNIANIQDVDKTYNQNLYPLDFTFNGHGYGHGLGLSQYGANGMAAQGKTFKDILNFYFNGITFKTLN